MKKYSTLFVLLLFATLSYSQDDDFTRNGRWTIETGATSFFGGVSANTGGSLFFDEGFTITQLSLDIGKFLTEDFVLRFRGSLLDLDGESATYFGVGGKYYLGGIAPLEVGGGLLSAGGESDFLADVHIGYAFKLASNIYFEPKAGFLYANSDLAGSVRFTFAMIL